MRIKYVKKSRIDQGRCGKCGDELPAGSAYRWIKHRYGPKRPRCMKPGCAFRNSDLTTSDKLSDLYTAQEQIEDTMAAFRKALPEMEPEDIDSELQSLAETISENMGLVEGAADGYEESASNLEDYFPGSQQIDDINEKAESCRSFHDELEEAKSEAEEAAEKVLAGGMGMSDIETVLDGIDDHVQSLEVN